MLKKAFMLLMVCAGLSAAEYTWTVKQEPASGLLKKGESFSCSVIVKKQGKVLEGAKLRLRYLNAFGTPVKTEMLQTGNPLKITGKAPQSPDWFRLEFALMDKSGRILREVVRKQRVYVRKQVGFMVDKDKYTQFIPEPADYEAFWKEVKAELKKVPMTVTARELPLQTYGKEKFTVKDVKVKCTNGIPVSGYLAVPHKAAPKSLPAIVTFHGAGVNSASLRGTLRWANMGAIAFDMNAHGVVNGKPREYYQNLRKTVYYCKQPDGSARYALRYINDPQKYYFRGMYQRVMRALEFVKKQPQWNGKDLIVIGASQGGAQVFAAAALDQQVSMVLAGVPAFSDFGGAVASPPRMAGWPLNSSEKATLPKDKKVLKCTAYFDNANFAKRIRVPIYVTAGLCDAVCPPVGIAVTFANLKSKVKTLQIYPQGGHGNSPNRAGYQALNKLLLSIKKSAAK